MNDAISFRMSSDCRTFGEEYRASVDVTGAAFPEEVYVSCLIGDVKGVPDGDLVRETDAAHFTELP